MRTHARREGNVEYEKEGMKTRRKDGSRRKRPH